MALTLKISPIVVGLTIVAMATSMPELLTSALGAYRGSYDLAVGNIVGSNICNIGLILGISALIRPIKIDRKLINTEMPLLFLVTVVFSLFALGGVGHVEGMILVGSLVVYLIFLIRGANKLSDVPEEEYTEEIGTRIESLSFCLLLVAIGGTLLAFGAEFLVGSATEMARRMEVSEVLIGITIVALGTSLPELATSVVAASRGQSDLVAGNIVGSNLFNILLIVGGVSAFQPLAVNKSLFTVEIPSMVVITLILWLIFITGRKVTRMEGIVLLVLYAAIIYLSINSHTSIFH